MFGRETVSEDLQISLAVLGGSAATVLVGYVIYRMTRTYWKRWLAAWWVIRDRGARRWLGVVCKTRDQVRLKWTQIGSCVLGTVLAAACMVLPIIGARRFFDEFRVPYSRDLHFKLLGGQLGGPIFLLALGIAVSLLTIWRKRIPWWLGVLGLLGALFTMRSVGPLSHDFSHTVFRQCSGIYGNAIGWMCITIAMSYLLVVAVDSIRWMVADGRRADRAARDRAQ